MWLPEDLCAARARDTLSESDVVAFGEVKVPKGMKTYIAVDARICSIPVWDRESGMTEFLTLLALAVPPAARSRSLPQPEWRTGSRVPLGAF